ncbi:MAG: TerB family tellurite resistance protein [Pseudomonadales bacterium]|nr:TerB family tellurite resistance protein [Pseudomonadales bacterium]
MSIANLLGVLKIFDGSEISPEEQAQLAKEVMLMTLARATASDTNIADIEVEKVREVLLARTGDDFSSSDVRVAANSSIYEKAPLAKYLATSAKKLASKDRVSVAYALAEVIKADGRVGAAEIEFFNVCIKALAITAAELAGLEEG